MINVYQPSLGKEELNRIEKVFESNWIGKGKLVNEFEEKYAAMLGTDTKHVISTNCCTEGLFSSMHLLDVKPEDEVILPTISFVGAANSICANGSKMVLCDVDPRTLNVRAEDIEKVITKKTKAILLLHFGGIPCEMDDIMDLANSHGIKVIEDCAAGVCSSYKGRALGTIGDMGMWSFDAMKILVCGDGAMLYFKDEEVRNRAEKWLYFGLETKSGYENSVAQKWWEFNISCYGHRAIMNDVAAAMALAQFEKLPLFMEKRKAVNDYYNDNLKEISWLELPPVLPENVKSSYYFYHIQIKNGKRDELATYLRQNGIYTTYRYFPIHRVKGYNVSGEFPNADYATDNTLCLPIHQSLSDSDMELVVNKIIEFGKQYC
ncbi:DegT/DnrJ/EryC1/StrS family aminotransferase [Butyrivibrio sp. NC2007]|uniref:DegT/DnrJ/EryC1/StrS family aminotransferase n=1 Tax=Butyrivibrio sp. NC2007 TaxID=1280683 RepID=UPI0003B68B5F|nr:DegT/DnrJ/EryC1/StrS family aminotransferase [Butyrivibrio sp. NC2007]